MSIVLGQNDSAPGTIDTSGQIKPLSGDVFHVMSNDGGVWATFLGTLTSSGTLTLGSTPTEDFSGSPAHPCYGAHFASTVIFIIENSNPTGALRKLDYSALDFPTISSNAINTSGTFDNVMATEVQSSYGIAFYGTAGSTYARAFTDNGVDGSGEIAINASFDLAPGAAYKIDADRAVLIGSNVTELQLVLASQTLGSVSVGTPSITNPFDAASSIICLSLDSTHFALLYSDSDGDIYYRIVTFSGNTVSNVSAETLLKSGTLLDLHDAAIMASGYFVILYTGDDTTLYLESGTISTTTLTLAGDAEQLSINVPAGQPGVRRVHDGLGVACYNDGGATIGIQAFSMDVTSLAAKFYHGQGPGEGVLAEKFTLPFLAVNPGAMTLDQSLGTVVIGTKAGDGTDAAVYSSYAYITGTSFSDGHPTGTSITSMKWV